MTLEHRGRDLLNARDVLAGGYELDNVREGGGIGGLRFGGRRGRGGRWRRN